MGSWPLRLTSLTQAQIAPHYTRSKMPKTLTITCDVCGADITKEKIAGKTAFMTSETVNVESTFKP